MYLYINKERQSNMKTSKFAIETRVENKKGLVGTITKIITKSTGYVEVTFDNGDVKKEMAFNLKNIEGETLKAIPTNNIVSEKALANYNKRVDNFRNQIAYSHLADQTNTQYADRVFAGKSMGK